MTYALTADPASRSLIPYPLPFLPCKAELVDTTTSLKMGVAPYASTNSALSRAGVDGAACILHAWNNHNLDSSPWDTHMLGGTNSVLTTGLSAAAGIGTANRYGSGAYDFYTRNTDSGQHGGNKKLERGGAERSTYIPKDQISAAVVQLATDVQRWRCMDDIRAATDVWLSNYLPCIAWEGEDGIEVRVSLLFAHGSAVNRPKKALHA